MSVPTKELVLTLLDRQSRGQSHEAILNGANKAATINTLTAK